MIDWSKISDKEEVVELVKQIELLSEKVIALDEMALVRYQLEILNNQEELNKINVCVDIKDEPHLKEAGELLKKYGQHILEPYFNLSIGRHLMFDDEYFYWYLSSGEDISCRTQITLQELETILKEQ